jgi:hypothetical protein
MAWPTELPSMSLWCGQNMPFRLDNTESLTVDHSGYTCLASATLRTLFVDVCLFVWWCLSTLFNNISVMVVVSFIVWTKPDNPEKTTDLSQVTDKLYHIILYTSPWSRFELTTSVVIGTVCIGSCKSNYHTIMATTTPSLFVDIKKR